MITATASTAAPIKVSSDVATDWLRARRFGIALALTIICLYPQVIIGTQTFVFRDFSIFGYPIASYHRECFWRGEIPLWNPLNNCGIPFLAQWNTLLLYPPSLIYLLLPLPWSLNLFCVLHLFLGGMGMFYLATRWTRCRLAGAAAGIAFAFSGILLISLTWPNIVAVLGWMPWVMLAAEQAWKEGGVKVWIAGLVGALQMLAATPEFILFTWLLVFGTWLIDKPTWKTLARLTAVVAVVTGLVAAQLLPFFDLLAQSQRNVLFDPGLRAMPRWGWANFLVPLFHTRPVPQGVYFPAEQPLFTSYYVTVPMLALAVYALVRARDRRVWFFWAVAVAGLWLAMGKHGYVYTWLLKLCPFLAFMRYPAKFLVLTIFALPLLGAFGLAQWRNQVSSFGSNMQVRLFAAICGAFVLLITGVVLYAHRYPLPDHDGPVIWWNGLWRVLFLIIAFVALLGVRRDRVDSRRYVACAVALLLSVLLDSLTHVPKHYPTAPSHVYAPGAIATRLKPPPHPERARALMGHVTHDFLFYNMLSDPFADLIGRRVSLFGNLNLLDNVAVLDGFYAMYLPAQRDIWKGVYTSSAETFPEGLADFLALTHITSHSNAMEWVVRSNAMSLVSVGQAPRFEEARSVFSDLFERSFDPRKVVYLPKQARASITVTGQTEARIVSERLRPHQLEVEVEAAEPSLVVVAQSYYHPWQAFIDGKSTRIWPANYAFQSVQVPAGHHKLRLVYRDRLFRLGVAVSGLTLGVVLLALFRFRSTLREMWITRND